MTASLSALRTSVEPTRAAVLVLHGGRVRGRSPARAWQLSVVRAALVAIDLQRSLRSEAVAVFRLRFAVRGWNGTERSPVADTRAALDSITHRLPSLPVVVVGHSMGGRAAVEAADHPAVAGVVALAPWLTENHQVETVRGRRLNVLHGTADTWTSPAASASFVQRAATVARSSEFTAVDGGGHFMIRRLGTWRRATVDAVRVQTVGAQTDPGNAR
jgi:pimeloyl-ACP methyl ester carboxylesterase